MLPQRVKVFEALCALYAKRLSYVHIRLIAIRADVPLSTASYELKKLLDSGVVVRRGVRGGWKPRYMYERTYRNLLDIYRRTQDYVRAQTIGDLQGQSHWTVRNHLKVLKPAGLVVQAQRGWKPKRRTDIVPAAGMVLDVLSELYVENFSFVRTVEIARRLDVSATHVRNVLRDYEGVGRVERLGQRGGWKPILPSSTSNVEQLRVITALNAIGREFDDLLDAERIISIEGKLASEGVYGEV